MDSMLLIPVILCFLEAFIVECSLEPRMRDAETNVTVVEGNTAVLPCIIENLGNYSVMWIQGPEVMLTNGDQRIIDDTRFNIERSFVSEWNLSIQGATSADGGIYRCQINTSPMQTKTIRLIVLVQVTIDDELSSKDTTIREGSFLRLICIATGVPKPDVIWYKVSDSSETKQGIGSGDTLTVPHVSRSDTGHYECVAYNGIPPAVSRMMMVFVEFPPQVLVHTRRISQLVGKDTIMECEITAYPPAVMAWRKGDEVIGSVQSSKYKVETYTDDITRLTLSLRVVDIQSDDFGIYTCYAGNYLGTAEEQLVLSEYRPRPQFSTPRSTVTSTSRVPLSSTVAMPQQTTTGSHETRSSTVAEKTVQVIIDDELSRKDSSLRDGNHLRLICSVTGVPNPDVTLYTLSEYSDTKEVAPQVIAHTRRIGQFVGKDTIMECEVTAYPHAIMNWRKGEEVIGTVQSSKYKMEVYSEGSTRKTLRLKVMDIQQDDFGTYTCYAENNYGIDGADVDLYEYRSRPEFRVIGVDSRRGTLTTTE